MKHILPAYSLSDAQQMELLKADTDHQHTLSDYKTDKLPLVVNNNLQ